MSTFLQGLLPQRHVRDNKGTVQDTLLLLYLLNKAGNDISGKDIFFAKIKLMKLVFLAEKKMVDLKLKGFNFFFNIFTKGPNSMELLHMIDHLREKGLVTNKQNSFVLTESGKEMAEDFEKNDGENTAFFSVIDETLSEYGKMSTEEILKKVYAMEIVPMHGTAAINIGEEVGKASKKRLLMSMSKQDVAKELDVSEDWIETVNLLMNPDLVV